MSKWKVTQIGKKPKLNKPILVEGLPGIGNVGKVAVDFMVEELKAKKLYDFFSYTFPHSVFVNEKNLVELPKIEIYYKKFGDKRSDIIFLAGDIQPIDEVSSYEFTDNVLDVVQKFDCKEIITLGGVGLQTVPKSPKVYCTANNKKIVEKYKKSVQLNEKLHGVVGPIIGVTGLLLGLSEKRKIDAIALLAETFGHPMYLGIKGAKEVLNILNKRLDLKLKLNKLDKEIEQLESEIKKSGEFSDVSKKTILKKVQRGEASYIG